MLLVELNTFIASKVFTSSNLQPYEDTFASRCALKVLFIIININNNIIIIIINF